MLKRMFFMSLVPCSLAFLTVTGGCGQDIAAQIDLAQSCEGDGYYRQAESVYRAIVADRPGTTEALAAQKNLVLLYFKMDNCAQAAQTLGELIEKYAKRPGFLDALHEVVGKYRYGSTRGSPGNAVEAWHVHRQIQHYADSPNMGQSQLAVRAMNAMILTELEPADAAVAIDKLTADFSGHPDLPRALWYIAEAYRKSQECEKASSICQRMAQCCPDSPYAGKARLDSEKSHILSLIDSKQDAQAQAAIKKLSTELGNYPGLLSVLDDIAGKYESLKKYDDAIATYHTMIEIDPHSELAAIAHQAIGWTYFARNDYDRAIEEYRKVLENYPQSVQLASTQYWIAQSYYKKRDYERAKDEYQRVISIYPESREAVYSEQKIGLIYLMLDMHDQAISGYRKLVNNYPGSGWAPDAQCRVAQCYYSKGDLERAIKEYQEVVEMYPSSRAAVDAEKQIVRLRNMMEK
jgi:TolA-binding protein